MLLLATETIGAKMKKKEDKYGQNKRDNQTETGTKLRL